MTGAPSDLAVVAPVPPDVPPALRGAVLARVAIPAEPADPRLLAALHPAERSLALAAPPRRAGELAAGRLALRRALLALGWDGAQPLLLGPQGRPVLPAGLSGSITHKDGLALAVARRVADGVTVGIDSEVVGARERSAIATRVLRAGERERWEREDGAAWPVLLARFSMKEAIYKALHPHVPRYIGFEEAEIARDGSITLHLAAGEGPFALFGWTLSEGEGAARRLVSLCAARPGGSA